MIRLTVLGVAALWCGAAWGQQFRPPPSPEEALAAVTEAGCKRTEEETYIRFHCEEGEALWYFTREGRPAHPAYTVFHDRQRSYDGPVQGRFGFGRGNSATNHEAFNAWNLEMYKVWEKTAPEASPFLREPRGKFYRLDPS